MKKSQLHDALSLMMYLGIDVDFGELTLCNLSHYSISRDLLERKYQVWSDDARCRFSNIYSNPQTAVDKFVALFNVIRSEEAKN